MVAIHNRLQTSFVKHQQWIMGGRVLLLRGYLEITMAAIVARSSNSKGVARNNSDRLTAYQAKGLRNSTAYNIITPKSQWEF